MVNKFTGPENTHTHTHMHLYTQLAALNGHDELVKLLLDNGANPFVKNQVENNVLHLIANVLSYLPSTP